MDSKETNSEGSDGYHQGGDKVRGRLFSLYRGTPCDVSLVDKRAGTPLDESDLPFESGRYISALDGNRYMVRGFSDDAIHAVRRKIEDFQWGESMELSPEQWADHQMKRIIFTDGDELVPLIIKTDGVITAVEYIPYHCHAGSLPTQVMIGNRILDVRYEEAPEQRELFEEGNDSGKEAM